MVVKNSEKTKEQIESIDLKIRQMKAKKQQLESRLKERERKDRTRRLIQVGAIFEKYFDFVGEEEAEKYALYFQNKARSEKENIKKIDLQKSKESNLIVYKQLEDK
jgi:hypothetical protein